MSTQKFKREEGEEEEKEKEKEARAKRRNMAVYLSQNECWIMHTNLPLELETPDTQTLEEDTLTMSSDWIWQRSYIKMTEVQCIILLLLS